MDEEDEFRGFNNHTMRRLIGFQPQRDFIVRRSFKPHAFNFEAPVTEIDHFFDDAFAHPKRGFVFAERPLNTRERWEEVEEKLYDSALRVRKEYDACQQGYSLIFEVPATSCEPVRHTQQLQEQEAHWVGYKGKYYNPEWVYRLSYEGKASAPNALLAVCPLRPLQPWRDRRSSSLAQRSFREKDLHAKGYFQISLGGWCEVSGLATLGGYPEQLERFPKSEFAKTLSAHDRKKWRKAIVRPPGRASALYVVSDNSQLAWVTAFDLHYRNRHTGKWLRWPSSFQGNVDVSTEHEHDFESTGCILTKEVRIYPLSWHHARSMRVCVLGRQLCSDTRGINQTHLCRGEEKQEGEGEIPTVTYEIIPPQRVGLSSVGKATKGSRWLRSVTKKGSDGGPATSYNTASFLRQALDDFDDEVENVMTEGEY